MVKNNPELETSPTTTLFLTLSNSAKGAELGGPIYAHEITLKLALIKCNLGIIVRALLSARGIKIYTIDSMKYRS